MTLKAVQRLEYIQKNITAKQLVDVGYPVFYKNTAIDTGNARNHTTKTTSEIDASYPYARRLDNGWSKQFPRGMTKPTLIAIRAYIKKTLGV